MSHSDSGTSRGGKAYSDSSPVHKPQYPLVRSPYYQTRRNPYPTAVPWAPDDSSTLSTSQSCENQSFTSHDDSISSAFTAERDSSGLIPDLRADGLPNQAAPIQVNGLHNRALFQDPHLQHPQVTPSSGSHTALASSGSGIQRVTTYHGMSTTAHEGEGHRPFPEPTRLKPPHFPSGSSVVSKPAQGSQRTANQPSHLCEHCGKRLSSKTALTRHVRNSHTPDVPMSSCPVPGCEYKTKRSDSLSRHVEKCRSKRERSLAAGVLSHTATARWNNEKPWSDLQVLTEAAHFQSSPTVGALDCMMAQGLVPYTTSRQDAERALKSAVSQRNKAQRHKNQFDGFWHEYPNMDQSSTYRILAQLDMELKEANREIARWRNILYVAEGSQSTQQ